MNAVTFNVVPFRIAFKSADRGSNPELDVVFLVSTGSSIGGKWGNDGGGGGKWDNGGGGGGKWEDDREGGLVPSRTTAAFAEGRLPFEVDEAEQLLPVDSENTSEYRPVNRHNMVLVRHSSLLCDILLSSMLWDRFITCSQQDRISTYWFRLTEHCVAEFWVSRW